MTMYGVLQIVGAVGGTVLGAYLGFHVWSYAGGVVGGGLGFWVGAWLGHLPYFLLSRQLSNELSNADVADLDRRVVDQFIIAHLVLAELARRGMELSVYESKVLGLMRSESEFKRSQGWIALQIWYPQRAEALRGYDPSAPLVDGILPPGES